MTSTARCPLPAACFTSLRRAAELLQFVLGERVPDAGGLDPHARLVAIFRKRHDVSRVGLAFRLYRIDQPEPCPRALEDDVRTSAGTRVEGRGRRARIRSRARSPASSARARACSRSSGRRSRAGTSSRRRRGRVGVSLKRTSGSCPPAGRTSRGCAAPLRTGEAWRPTVPRTCPPRPPAMSTEHARYRRTVELVLEERVEHAVIAEETPEVCERDINRARGDEGIASLGHVHAFARDVLLVADVDRAGDAPANRWPRCGWPPP